MLSKIHNVRCILGIVVKLSKEPQVAGAKDCLAKRFSNTPKQSWHTRVKASPKKKRGVRKKRNSIEVG